MEKDVLEKLDRVIVERENLKREFEQIDDQNDQLKIELQNLEDWKDELDNLSIPKKRELEQIIDCIKDILEIE